MSVEIDLVDLVIQKQNKKMPESSVLNLLVIELDSILMMFTLPFSFSLCFFLTLFFPFTLSFSHLVLIRVDQDLCQNISQTHWWATAASPTTGFLCVLFTC